MADNRERLTSLNSAAGLCVLRRSLGSAGTTGIVLALILFGIAGLWFANVGVNGAVIVLGVVAAALLAGGIYVLRTRSRTALACETATLAVLATWDLGRFGYSLHLHSTGAARGHLPNPLIGLLIAYSAWKTWSSRREFTRFAESSTEADGEHVESVIATALSSSPNATPNMVQLKQAGLSVKNPQWRIWFDPEFAYLINLRVFFGRTRPIAVTVCDRSSLSFEVTGETWLGNARKLKLIVDGDAAAAAYEISPEMLEKMSRMTGVSVP